MRSLVSVIIPTYNRSFSILYRAVHSVLNQSYKNLELIIVDDNDVNSKYRKEIEARIKNLVDNRVKYIQHTSNSGACEARNTGIRNAKGEFIAFLDDDDEWLSNKLELQLQKFTNKEVGLVYCDSYTIKTKNDSIINKSIRSFRISGMVYKQLLEKNFVGSTSFVLIRKEALNECGFFNTEMESAQDYELWLRLSKKYKIDYVDIPLVNYYAHEGERISTNVNKKIQGLEQIIKLNYLYLQEHPKILSKRKSVIVPYYYLRDGYKKAFLKSWDSFKLNPFNTHLLKVLVKITIKEIFK